MTQEQIKQKIATIEKSIAALKKQNGSPDQIKKLEDGKTKLEGMLDDGKDEPKGVSTKDKEVSEDEPKAPSKKKKVVVKPKSKPVSKDKPKSASQKPEKKDIKLEKQEKKETHTIETAFADDIKGAILTLNKKRFKLVTYTDRKTGKKETVQHTVEYRNAKIIQKQVDKIFSYGLADVVKSNKDKQEKKELIGIVEEIRDLHCLWINELDIMIANEETKDLQTIKKLMLDLIKEARKNDEDNKWRKAGGLSEIAKKFDL